MVFVTRYVLYLDIFQLKTTTESLKKYINNNTIKTDIIRLVRRKKVKSGKLAVDDPIVFKNSDDNLFLKIK